MACRQRTPPGGGEGAGKVGRHGRVELERFAGARVDQPKMGGMEGQARDRHRVLALGAVDGVAEHGVAKRGEVDANLVRTAGPELRLDEGDGAEALQRPEHRPCRLAASQDESGPPGAGARAPDPALDEHLLVDVAGHQRTVATAHGVRAELALQVLGRRVVAGEHHDARSVAIEPVDDFDLARVTEAPGELHHETGEHRIFLAVGGGVHEHSRGLVDHHQVVVDVEDLDPRPPWHGGTARQPGLMGDDGVGAQDMSRVGDDGAVHRGVADQDLALGAAVGRSDDLLQSASQALVAGRCHLPHHRYNSTPAGGNPWQEVRCRSGAVLLVLVVARCWIGVVFLRRPKPPVVARS